MNTARLRVLVCFSLFLACCSKSDKSDDLTGAVVESNDIPSSTVESNDTSGSVIEISVVDEIEIITFKDVDVPSLDGIGQFVLEIDEDGRCLYFTGENGKRGTVVWPADYRVTRDGDSLQVTDSNGAPRISIGVPIEMRGGFETAIPSSWILATTGHNLCEADVFFIAAELL